jgi:hypothetical protein
MDCTDKVSCRAHPGAIDHAKGVYPHSLGDAIRRAPNKCSDLCSVPIAIADIGTRRRTALVTEEVHATIELVVRKPRSTIENIDKHIGDM